MANNKALTRRNKHEVAAPVGARPNYRRNADWIVADVSGSMECYLPNSSKRRIDCLNDAIAEQSTDTQILAFSTTVVHSTERKFTAQADTNLIPALSLVKDYEPSYILIISDGNINDLHSTSLQLVDEIFEAGCIVDTLYIGPDDKYAQEFMAELAQHGGGRARRFDLTARNDAAQLDNAVQAFLPAPDKIVEL